MLNKKLIYSVALISVMSAQGIGFYDVDLSLEGSNTLQSQVYLDNYTQDFGDGPLASVGSKFNLVINNTQQFLSMLDFRGAFYPEIKTYVGSLGLTNKFLITKDIYLGFSLAGDYTDYDSLKFYQLVLSPEISHSIFSLRVNAYSPFGSTQSFEGSSSPGDLTGLYGGDITAEVSLSQFTVALSGSVFTHDDINESISAATVSTSYSFNKNLQLGAEYGRKYSLNSGDYGFSVYADFPLYINAMYSKNKTLPTKLSRRMLGSVFSAVS